MLQDIPNVSKLNFLPFPWKSSRLFTVSERLQALLNYFENKYLKFSPLRYTLVILKNFVNRLLEKNLGSCLLGCRSEILYFWF